MVIWLAMVGGLAGPLPASGVTAAGAAVDETLPIAAAAGGFCFAGRGLARLATDTLIVGKTAAPDGAGGVAGAAALGASSVDVGCGAVCARASGHRNENNSTAAANGRDAMNSPKTKLETTARSARTTAVCGSSAPHLAIRV
jgi:hypothetical protein